MIAELLIGAGILAVGVIVGGAVTIEAIGEWIKKSKED